MTEPTMPTSHAVIAVDIEDYSSRNDVQQYHLQKALTDVLDAAAGGVGLDRARWAERQPQGDGEFAWLPPDVHVGVLIGPFVRELHAQLGVHNRRRAGEFWTPMRLRMALHYGPVRLGAAVGVAGNHAVQPGRLLDSVPLRRALDACPAADLALIISERIYGDFVTQGLGNPDEYRKVRVEVKKQRYIGYVHVPGHDLRKLDALDPFQESDGDGRGAASPADLPPGPLSPAPAAGSVVHGDVIGGDSHRAGAHGTIYAAGRDQYVPGTDSRRGA